MVPKYKHKEIFRAMAVPMEPVDIHMYYAERAAKFLKSRDTRRQVEEIKRMEATVVILDFCGKTPLVYKLFAGVEKEVFVVYDVSKCKERIGEVVRKHDLVYVLEDVESMEKNIFYGNKRAIFLLFDRFKFIRCI